MSYIVIIVATALKEDKESQSFWLEKSNRQAAEAHLRLPLSCSWRQITGAVRFEAEMDCLPVDQKPPVFFGS